MEPLAYTKCLSRTDVYFSYKEQIDLAIRIAGDSFRCSTFVSVEIY